MVYLFAKTSKTFQTHFPLAATHQAPPLNRALIGCPRDSLKYPVRFHEFFLPRELSKRRRARATPLVTLALERATGEGRPNRSV